MTVPIYFKHNKFFFDDLDLLADFAAKGQGSHLPKIQRAIIIWVGHAPARAAKQLLNFTGLRELTLCIEPRSLAGSTTVFPYEPKLWGMKKLLKIRGLTKLDFVFPTTLNCSYKACPDAVRNGAYNLAGDQSVTAFKQTMEVLKEPRG